MTEEWNQWLADSRDIETMRRIALDALSFGNDDAAFYTYAAEHNLKARIQQVLEEESGCFWG